MNAPTVSEHCSTSTPYNRYYDENVSHNMRMTNMIITALNIKRGKGAGWGRNVTSALIWMLALNELMRMNSGDDEDDEDDNDDMMGVAKKKRRRRKMVVMCWRWCWNGPRHLSGKPRTLNPTTCCCFGIQSEVNNHS